MNGYELTGTEMSDIGHPRPRKFTGKDWALIISSFAVIAFALGAIVFTWQ